MAAPDLFYRMLIVLPVKNLLFLDLFTIQPCILAKPFEECFKAPFLCSPVSWNLDILIILT